jgi:hypothetical protein
LRSRFFLENKIRDIRTKKKLPPDLSLSHNELKQQSAHLAPIHFSRSREKAQSSLLLTY